MRCFIAVIAAALGMTGCSQQAAPPICTALYAYGLTVTAVGRPVEAHVDGEPALMTPITVEPLGSVTLLGAPAT